VRPRQRFDCGEDGEQLLTRDGPAQRALHPTLRFAIFERDGYACAMCGSRHDIMVDHIVAEGDDDSDNLRTLCRGCSIEHA
jgi:5-methylcytosine-specific restriction endonuclease McrA